MRCGSLPYFVINEMSKPRLCALREPTFVINEMSKPRLCALREPEFM